MWHFVRHYLEMVVAMLVGMYTLGGLENLIWPATVRADVCCSGPGSVSVVMSEIVGGDEAAATCQRS